MYGTTKSIPFSASERDTHAHTRGVTSSWTLEKKLLTVMSMGVLTVSTHVTVVVDSEAVREISKSLYVSSA
jgi:hypothetical protein